MRISEDFYSIQGEGVTQGVPAYFIRLQGCNLCCGGSSGSLLKEGKATWWCDTETVWRHGQITTSEQLVEKMQKSGQLENILDGITHLIWTGGEPTMFHNREAIVGFCEYMRKRFGGNNIYNEIETNGTVKVEDTFYDDYIHQINCSPKLSNSGMKMSSRINDEALIQICNQENSWFKFVVSNEQDVSEAYNSFIVPFSIPKTHVYLMPGVDKLSELSERTRFVYEMAKKYGYRATTRGQILAYDRTTGV